MALSHLPSNNGALWRPSLACLVAELFGQTSGRHSLLAYVFKVSLCPVRRNQAHRHHSRQTFEQPHFPSGTNTSHPPLPRIKVAKRVQESPSLQVGGIGQGCCEEEVDQESPRPDTWPFLLRVLLWESFKDWFQGLGSSQFEDAIP